MADEVQKSPRANPNNCPALLAMSHSTRAIFETLAILPCTTRATRVCMHVAKMSQLNQSKTICPDVVRGLNLTRDVCDACAFANKSYDSAPVSQQCVHTYLDVGLGMRHVKFANMRVSACATAISLMCLGKPIIRILACLTSVRSHIA